MYCRNCGKELLDNSNFCSTCGAKQQDDVKVRTTTIIGQLKKYNRLLYVYVLWVLVHISLFLFSSPYQVKDNYGNFQYNTADGFYPFNKSLGYVFKHFPYFNFSLIDNCDAYDISELFVYIILLPMIIIGIVWYYPNFTLNLKKCYFMIKEKYYRWKTEGKVWYYPNFVLNLKKNYSMIKEKCFRRKNENIKQNDNVEDVFSDESSKEGSLKSNLCAEVVELDEQIQHEQQETKVYSEFKQSDFAQIETKIEDLQTMSLIRRFFASLIDKFFLIILFVIGYVIISPYGAFGKMGSYFGLLNVSPNNYEYVDKIAIERFYNYNTSSFDDGVDPYYRAQQRIADLKNPPHMGSTKENDLNITLSFILLNLIYYIIFEFFLGASPFKALFGGILIDRNKKKIGFGNVLFRALCGGVFMLLAVFWFHFHMNLSYSIVFVLFFLILDIPIFFTRQSLLDLCTGTIYARK